MNKLLITCLLIPTVFFAQDYKFTSIKDIACTDVKSQGSTGTCWSFSTTSFFETEAYRLTGKLVDLSEMYTVRHTYPKKAWNYVMRQGKAQFSEGGLAHDVIHSVRDYGLVPESAYSGLDADAKHHNHAEMVAVLKGMLEVYVKNPARKLSPKWKQAIESILDTYLGKDVTSFIHEGKTYTPESFKNHEPT